MLHRLNISHLGRAGIKEYTTAAFYNDVCRCCEQFIPSLVLYKGFREFFRNALLPLRFWLPAAKLNEHSWWRNDSSSYNSNRSLEFIHSTLRHAVRHKCWIPKCIAIQPFRIVLLWFWSMRKGRLWGVFQSKHFPGSMTNKSVHNKKKKEHAKFIEMYSLHVVVLFLFFYLCNTCEHLSIFQYIVF